MLLDLRFQEGMVGLLQPVGPDLTESGYQNVAYSSVLVGSAATDAGLPLEELSSSPVGPDASVAGTQQFSGQGSPAGVGGSDTGFPMPGAGITSTGAEPSPVGSHTLFTVIDAFGIEPADSGLLDALWQVSPVGIEFIDGAGAGAASLGPPLPPVMWFTGPIGVAPLNLQLGQAFTVYIPYGYGPGSYFDWTGWTGTIIIRTNAGDQTFAMTHFGNSWFCTLSAAQIQGLYSLIGPNTTTSYTITVTTAQTGVGRTLISDSPLTIWREKH